MRVLGSGVPACLTVTVLDGLVLARSAFEHSANYRSALLLGRFREVSDPDERRASLRAFVEALVPGRWPEVRPPSAAELQATSVLALEINEASAKIRSGPPTDDGSTDAQMDVWAGELPFLTSFGSPLPSPGLAPGIEVSPSVRALAGRGRAAAD